MEASALMMTISLLCATAASTGLPSGSDRCTGVQTAAPCLTQDHVLLQRSAARELLQVSGQVSDGDRCAVPKAGRHGCGHFGITRHACESKGCCWEEHQTEGSQAPLCFHGQQAEEQEPRDEPAQEEPVECSTASEGDQCHAAVTWAMQHGIAEHPEWYPDTLSVSSSFEDFQAHFKRIGREDCPRPCDSCHTAEAGEACHGVVTWAKYNGIKAYPHLFPGLNAGATLKEFQHTVSSNGRIAYIKDPPILDNAKCQSFMAITGCDWTSERSCPGQRPAGSNGTAKDDGSLAFECCCTQRLWRPVCPEPCSLCRTATEGEQCFADVKWAMEVGVKQHPQWYLNLTAASHFREFQAYLKKMKHPCPTPCGMCSTAKPGSRCFEGVTWAMEHGIVQHPEWYPDLSASSSFGDFQAHLHKGGYEGCPAPCS